MASEVSRRDLLRSAALAFTAGAFTPVMGQHVHQMAADERAATGAYEPKALNDHEYHTLQRLCDLIVPAEEKSPGALAAGAADWIDLMSSQSDEMKAVYTGGIAWLDEAMRRDQSDFLGAAPDRQTAMLDLIAYRKNESPELGAGIHFFAFARRMIVDAYYTSPLGVKDLEYLGNKALSEFVVPQECLDWALNHSPQ